MTSIDMLMFCPRCGAQHVDRADETKGWTNPPHATHTCQCCGLLWRPSNANTNGVAILPAEEAKHVERIAATWPGGHGDTRSAREEVCRNPQGSHGRWSATERHCYSCGVTVKHGEELICQYPPDRKGPANG